MRHGFTPKLSKPDGADIPSFAGLIKNRRVSEKPAARRNNRASSKWRRSANAVCTTAISQLRGTRSSLLFK